MAVFDSKLNGCRISRGSRIGQKMNGRIRVLHVLSSLDRGGAETLVVEWLRNLDHSQFELTCVVTDREVPYALEEEVLLLGGKVLRSPRLAVKNLKGYLSWWLSTLRRGTWDIVHAHYMAPAALYLLLARFAGSFTIAHSHNVGETSTMKGRVRQFLQWPVRLIAEDLVACSADAGRAMFGPGACFRVIANGVDTKRFEFCQEVREQNRSALGLDLATPVVGHVGNFRAVKNHARLLDIHEAVLALRPTARLLLIGDGELRSEIEGEIVARELQDSVMSLGPRSDVPALLSVMDALVFPSESEGLGISLIEAQASGLPSVVSDVVPQEVALTDLIEFQGLGSSDDVWARRVCAALNRSVERNVYPEQVRAHGYDSECSTRSLEEIYKAAVVPRRNPSNV